jgi:hypothetical protein
LKQAEFLSKPGFGGIRNQRSLEEGKSLFKDYDCSCVSSLCKIAQDPVTVLLGVVELGLCVAECMCVIEHRGGSADSAWQRLPVPTMGVKAR